MSLPEASIPSTTTNSAARKPRVSLAIATAFGLGYLPKAPGTFGSLAGVALAFIPPLSTDMIFTFPPPSNTLYILESMSLPIALTILIAIIGVMTAHTACRFWVEKDPQRVVIDEVSGQYLALVLGVILPQGGSLRTGFPRRGPIAHPLLDGLNWKYLLLGFILFRVFDIWKPFPARQAESLPGGLGIMADDWIAGIYAALGLWVARALGL